MENLILLFHQRQKNDQSFPAHQLNEWLKPKNRR